MLLTDIIIQPNIESLNQILKHTCVIRHILSSYQKQRQKIYYPPNYCTGTNHLAKTKLVRVNRRCDLRKSAESESALHFTHVVIQNRLRTERLSQLETVGYLQRLANGSFSCTRAHDTR